MEVVSMPFELRRLLTVLSLLLLAGLAPLIAAAQSGALPAKDVTAIKAQAETFSKGMNAAEFAKVAALYAENATLMPPNEPALAGRAAIESWMKGLPPVKDFALNVVEVQGHGDLAYTRGTYSMTITPPGAPGPVKDNGKFVEVRRRQKDGSWQIITDIFNSDLPPGK
jgi:uncharacterized protein (TIGR02246 family)